MLPPITLTEYLNSSLSLEGESGPQGRERGANTDASSPISPPLSPGYVGPSPSRGRGTVLFLAAESGAAMPIAAAFGHLEPSPNVHFLIGPEGGFSAAEFLMFDKYPAIRRMRLGPRLLRAETAAGAVLSVFQAVTGDWRISTN